MFSVVQPCLRFVDLLTLVVSRLGGIGMSAPDQTNRWDLNLCSIPFLPCVPLLSGIGICSS